MSKGTTNAQNGVADIIIWGYASTAPVTVRLTASPVSSNLSGGKYPTCKSWAMPTWKWGGHQFYRGSATAAGIEVPFVNTGVTSVAQYTYNRGKMTVNNNTIENAFLPDGLEVYMAFYATSVQITKVAGDNSAKFNGGIVKVTGHGYNSSATFELADNYIAYNNERGYPSNQTIFLMPATTSNTIAECSQKIYD